MTKKEYLDSLGISFTSAIKYCADEEADEEFMEQADGLQQFIIDFVDGKIKDGEQDE